MRDGCKAQRLGARLWLSLHRLLSHGLSVHHGRGLLQSAVTEFNCQYGFDPVLGHPDLYCPVKRRTISSTPLYWHGIPRTLKVTKQRMCSWVSPSATMRPLVRRSSPFGDRLPELFDCHQRRQLLRLSGRHQQWEIRLQQSAAVGGHSLKRQWHTAAKAWHMYERDVSHVAGNVANPDAE
jgi:hypothetical protein